MEYLIGETFLIIAFTAFVFFAFGYLISFFLDKSMIRKSGVAFKEQSSGTEKALPPEEKVVIKEVIKEVPIEKVVATEVVKVVVKEVPVIQKVVEQVPVEHLVYKEKVSETPPVDEKVYPIHDEVPPAHDDEVIPIREEVYPESDEATLIHDEIPPIPEGEDDYDQPEVVSVVDEGKVAEEIEEPVVRDGRPIGKLTDIWGIGEQTVELLNEHGIHTVEDLARLKGRKYNTVAKIIPFDRLNRESWVEQARKMLREYDQEKKAS